MSLPPEFAARRTLPTAPVRQLIEERALFTPDAIAVGDADGRAFSWHELNARANRLADRLCALGAGPDRPVGLTGRSGAATVIGWLAALKADAAIVPLGAFAGPEAERMLEDAGAKVLLTAGAPEAPAGVTAISVLVEGSAPSTPNLSSRSRPDHAVFVVPGAHSMLRVTRRDLDDLVRWQANAFDPASDARVGVLMSTAELAGLRVVAGTLALGGTLCFAPATCGTSPALWDFLIGAKVTRLCIASEVLDDLVSAEETRGLALESLRDVVVLGGTLRLTPDVLRFFSIHAPCRVHTLHGSPDSAVIGACTLELPFAETPQRRRATPGPPTELHQAGVFSARVAVPAVA